MQNRAIKYRIYPSAEQKVLFAKTFGCCRKIWNLMLADKITYYQQTQKMLQTTPAQYKKTYPYLKEVAALHLQMYSCICRLLIRTSSVIRRLVFRNSNQQNAAADLIQPIVKMVRSV